VRDGYVTIEGAARDYGVVVSGDSENDPENLVVDLEASEQLRRSLRGS
jgi:N-methylhydantoinase B